jgi:hypothetical protein
MITIMAITLVMVECPDFPQLDAARIITSAAPNTVHFLIFRATTLIVISLPLEGTVHSVSPLI